MTKDSASEQMRKELLKSIRSELSKFENRKDPPNPVEPSNSKGDGKAKQNEATQNTQVEQSTKQTSSSDSATTTPVITQEAQVDEQQKALEAQVQASEREKVLEAQVADLQRKLEMLIRNAEGARGGDGHAEEERTAGARDRNRNTQDQHDKQDEGAGATQNGQGQKSEQHEKTVPNPNERSDHYQQKGKILQAPDERESRRGSRISPNANYDGGNRNRGQEGGDWTGSEHFCRTDDEFCSNGVRQSQQRGRAETVNQQRGGNGVLDPPGNNMTSRLSGFEGRDRYRHDFGGDMDRNEQFRQAYDRNQFGRAWQPQGGIPVFVDQHHEWQQHGCVPAAFGQFQGWQQQGFVPAVIGQPHGWQHHGDIPVVQQ